MRHTLLAVVLTSILASSCSTLGKLGLKPTSFETVLALKSILDSSTFRAINKLKGLDDSGIESLLPEQLAPVLSTLRTVGYGDEVDEVSRSIGIASKAVVIESEGIMKDAIGNLKFTDAAAVVL